MPVYNKLVRDLIPQIIEAGGKTCSIRVLEQGEHLEEIKAKMQEEALEFLEAVSPKEAIEELADMLELVHAALQMYGVSYEQLEQLRIQKKMQRGGFSKGIYLVEVKE
ncbi:nucleoside triphosphate pyrophosphohydrolase [Lysinibacillus agricola]|uniref:Nucleoside triphosphate pyrophosphohydrolase n=1 Tax=Lysinibacillus agricola TaxID=2590012 RepID=A0ABX7AWQ0_9BACI|nr:MULTISPECIES: nucleoside triphosphate pyrophosphohydrolase [Lysinibacillus]KOS63459.1 phosphoribosyl-ATP pyrophosphohydrolase [Lysinibacillus sp. FJAT-14222]QQP14201.1 nucleoside triphosphate pyrophosphohydrolase [Lysinibacillus agricola]